MLPRALGNRHSFAPVFDDSRSRRLVKRLVTLARFRTRPVAAWGATGARLGVALGAWRSRAWGEPDALAPPFTTRPGPTKPLRRPVSAFAAATASSAKTPA